MPRLEERCDDEAPPSPEGLDATAGPRAPDEEDEPPRVAMQVGMTKEGSELPAKLGEGRPGERCQWVRVTARGEDARERGTDPIFV